MSGTFNDYGRILNEDTIRKSFVGFKKSNLNSKGPEQNHRKFYIFTAHKIKNNKKCLFWVGVSFIRKELSSKFIYKLSRDEICLANLKAPLRMVWVWVANMGHL